MNLSLMAQVTWDVTPLEWGSTSHGTPEVYSVVGVYRITEAWSGGWAVSIKNEVLRGPDGRTNFATQDDAKVAAQADYEARVLSALTPPAKPLQARVKPWMDACFGPEISADKLERGDRLLEEVFELLQSGDYPRERIRALENYVWSRPVGEPAQEVGGVMITLAAYCLAHGIDMHEAGEAELARINTPEMIAKIRAKQAAKPTGSALPIAVDEKTAEGRDIPADATGDIGSDAGGPQPLAACGDDPDLNARLAASVAAFKALTPEQQREVFRRQGERWARAEAELSRLEAQTTIVGTPRPAALPRYRHRKRGTTYELIGEAELQLAITIGRLAREGDRLAIYRGEDGQLWARFAEEFHDGRFERIDRAAAIAEGQANG